MFERFSDAARRVVVLGQEEARNLNHDYIGTEHLLLGLAHEGGGRAARVLESLGIGLGDLRQQVEEIIGRGKNTPSGHIPFTPRAKKALELAVRESDALGHGFVDTEHVLLGLLAEGEGVAVQVLARLGADLASVRQQVLLLAPRRAGLDPFAARPRRGRRQRAVVDDALASISSLVDPRLAAIERWVGMAPDVDDLDREIAHVRREKESAIEDQDFESAAALRDKERGLIERRSGREREWTAASDGRLSAAAELAQLRAELERLREVLRQHGIAGA